MKYNPFALTNKTILVTGASSGIGRSIAIECSKMGARVIITGRNSTKLEQTMNLLDGEGHLSYPADLHSDQDIEKLSCILPPLDGVVHNAGISKRNLCKDIEEQDYIVMSTNFSAPVNLQKALLSEKKINKGASIVFTASIAPFAPVPGNAMYSASKGALISYAKVLALELAPRMIRVNCICPAMVWTELLTNDGTMSREDMEQNQLKYPLKRYGQPEDVAYLALYLLSNASAWMTGSCIDITGGSRAF